MPKPKVTCPRCGYEKATPNAQGPDKIHCKKCGGLVDFDPNEGGDYDDRNPAARLMRNERR